MSISGLGEPYADKLTGQNGLQQGPLTLNGPLDRVYWQPAAHVSIQDGERETGGQRQPRQRGGLDSPGWKAPALWQT